MTDPVRRRSLDPQGKRALFTTPVTAAPDAIRPKAPSRGKQALYSSERRRRGTAVVDCASCGTRTRLSLAALAGSVALSLPTWRGLTTRRMRCPACHRWTPCRLGLTD